MALHMTCQALPAPGAQRTATNMPAFMLPAKPVHARGVAVLASGKPFTSADREASPAFWRPDCPPDENEARPGSLLSMWPRKVTKKVERPYPTAWEADSLRPAFRNTIEEVNYMNTRIQFREAKEQQQQPAKRFNPLRLLGL